MSGLASSLLADRVELRGVLRLELHQAPDAHLRYPLEAERRQGPFDGLALRVQNPLLRPDQDTDPGQAAPLRSSQAENGSPVISW